MERGVRVEGSPKLRRLPAGFPPLMSRLPLGHLVGRGVLRVFWLAGKPEKLTLTGSLRDMVGDRGMASLSDVELWVSTKRHSGLLRIDENRFSLTRIVH